MIGSIEYEVVTSTADTLSKSAEEMRTILTDTTTLMNSLKDIYQSDSATALQENFDSLKTKFDSFSEEIKSYSKFLTDTVAAYKAADEAIANKANDNLAS